VVLQLHALQLHARWPGYRSAPLCPHAAAALSNGLNLQRYAAAAQAATASKAKAATADDRRHRNGLG